MEGHQRGINSKKRRKKGRKQFAAPTISSLAPKTYVYSEMAKCFSRTATALKVRHRAQDKTEFEMYYNSISKCVRNAIWPLDLQAA